MKGRTVAFLTALLIIFCAVLSSCREPSGNVLPVITANHAEPETTDEPFAIVTDAPTEEPQFEKPVSFSDINFENAVREAIGRQIGSIYPSDLAGITVFSARVRGIVRIDEIVYFSSLEELDLMGNKIIDLSPLSTLTNLKTLNISKNFSVLMGNRKDY